MDEDPCPVEELIYLCARKGTQEYVPWSGRDRNIITTAARCTKHNSNALHARTHNAENDSMRYVLWFISPDVMARKLRHSVVKMLF